MQDNLLILSVNVNRQPSALITILETTDVSILLIQEPSWGRLVPKKSDDDPEGVEVYGTCSHPRWRTILPIMKKEDPDPHVAIFLRTDLTDSFTYSILPDTNSYSCLGLRLDTNDPIFIINYYHHVINKWPNLRHLLSLTIPDGPLLLCGDFNTHSTLWSPPDLPTSSWAPTLETWLDDNNLMSLVPDGAITRRSTTGRDSTLNHIFINMTFLGNPSFPAACSISFERSISSDHAALFIDLPLMPLPPVESPQTGWLIEDQMEQEWKRAFTLFPHPLITDIPSLTRASDDLIKLTHATCDKFFSKKKPKRNKGLAWWNESCSIAATDVSRAHGPEQRRRSSVLHATIRHAKRDWIEKLITDPHTTIWDMAKWRHGRRSPWIPPINGSSDTTEMGAAFEQRFFHFPSPDKPTLTLPGQRSPKRPFYKVTNDKVSNALKHTSNKSALGPSGINYKLVKWAFGAHPDFILDIYNTALRWGHHPWTSATVVIIPKPNKMDYSEAKAYRPVSLLECFGKVLEKVVANRLTSDSNLHDILPPSQFGSRPYHCAMDACTLLRYKASTMINSGRIGGTLLFDISRFFDHLDPSFTARVLDHLGIDDRTIKWVRDFMTRQRIKMSFNNHLTDDIFPDLGTPQGSPLSPILSALVTGPILRLADTWTDTDLTLYVDNGNIFASSPTYEATTAKLTRAANQVSVWLQQAGFSVDKDKCEVMFFHPKLTPKHVEKHGKPPSKINLLLPNDTDITIKPAAFIRYLGVFFTPRLNWSTHVKIISTRARSIVKGLGVLGNSIRGFHLVAWRRIFISVILPVLTYGCQVWFRDVSQASLIKTLQIAQNEACRKLAGTFHTTPTSMLHSLLSIPPIHYRLHHLLRLQGHCLASQPPSCLLRHPEKTRKVTLIPSHVPTAPILPPIAETPPMKPIFSFPNHPATPPWSHDRVTLNPRTKNTLPSLTALKSLKDTTIFLSSAPFHIPKLFLHIFAIYKDSRLIISDYTLASTPTSSLLLATTSSLQRVGDCPERRVVTILYSDAGLPTLNCDNRIISRNVTLINTLHHTFDTLLYTNPLSSILGHWFSRRWVNARATEWFSPTVEAAFQATLSTTQTIHKPLTERLLEDWRASWTPPPPGDPRRHFSPLGEPPDTSLHPFVLGVLTAQSRAYQSAAFQLITGHAFDAGYSACFRATAGDNTSCPHCGDTHTIDHILFECDHFWYERATILECDKSYLFSTTSGGKMLVRFLH